jgi:hypothetical protein
MKNKNFRKLKYVSGKPPECRILHHLPYSFWRPWRPTDLRPKFFSLASLAVLHLLFHYSLLLLKVLKALIFYSWNSKTRQMSNCPKFNGCSIFMCQTHFCVHQFTVSSKIMCPQLLLTYTCLTFSCQHAVVVWSYFTLLRPLLSFCMYNLYFLYPHS